MTESTPGNLHTAQETRIYKLHWWMGIYVCFAVPVLIAIHVIGFGFLGMMLLPAGVVGWIVFLILVALALHTLAGFSLVFASFRLLPHGVCLLLPFVRILVPWENVTSLTYHRWPYHEVRVRNVRPLQILLFSPLLPGESFGLIAGLKDRNELFWEIWRRASQAQGCQIPVEGYRGPIPPL